MRRVVRGEEGVVTLRSGWCLGAAPAQPRGQGSVAPGRERERERERESRERDSYQFRVSCAGHQDQLLDSECRHQPQCSQVTRASRSPERGERGQVRDVGRQVGRRQPSAASIQGEQSVTKWLPTLLLTATCDFDLMMPYLPPNHSCCLFCLSTHDISLATPPLMISHLPLHHS